MQKKMFMGLRLRRLRTERGLSQIAMAQALGLSASYLNQLEQDQRPLTMAVLLKLEQSLGVDIQAFSADEAAGLVAGMREALADAPQAITLPELQAVASQMPALAHALIAMHRRNAAAAERLEAMAMQMDDERADTADAPALPYEVVRDFFFAHQNYFDALDRRAEALAAEAAASRMPLHEWLTHRLERLHGVRTQWLASSGDKRRYDGARRLLSLSSSLEPAQAAFQLGTQLALLESAQGIDELVAVPPFTHDAAARKLARLGLANYFAGALLLPYGQFLQAAEAHRHDIELLQQRFGVGFETVCHRLSTLQRPGAAGIPFFFVRVDRAGNISKRQSATHFHFSRTGGTCPLWKVYEAFGQPQRILRQVARMPDGRTYLWIARMVADGPGGFGVPRKTFAIGLGCDVRHAQRLVYAKGLDIRDTEAATPIGMGCKVCERPDCQQRAFPFVGRPLDIDEHRHSSAPYAPSVAA